MVANTVITMAEKGGSSKTTLCDLLAQALGDAGYKTCAGDLDGQCNLTDRKSTRLNSSHSRASRMPSSA